MAREGTQEEQGFELAGLRNLEAAHWNLTPAELVEEVVRRGEGVLSNPGSVVVQTGLHTGRSPNDKYVVRNPEQETEIWWGKVNQPMAPAVFEHLLLKVQAYLQGREVFVKDLRAGAHPDHTLPIRVITEKAWQSLFAHDLFIRLAPKEARRQVPGFTILVCPDYQASPAEDGVNSSTIIGLDFNRRLVLIVGSSYAGEIKKSVFTVLNYLLPREGILSMHCSANVGRNTDTALFFGLSGTGKTSLSSDPERGLIGDDEHGWADDGVFNFEGGCYAKTIKLSQEYEPLIWSASRRFGTVLENVVCDPKTRNLDFDDGSLTENTRAAYPIDYVPGHIPVGYAGHPKNIFFLTADAFGVIPPISRLTPEQAMYYFLSGYTSKLAGTEKGLGAEPQATFSCCFGAPFLPLPPSRYAALLGEKIEHHKAQVWLVNTGWTGGPFGVGKRIHLPYTRAMVKAALTGELTNINFMADGYFGLNVPESCPGVPSEVLLPEKTWAGSMEYKQQARKLIERFEKNFEQFKGDVSEAVTQAGPRVG